MLLVRLVVIPAATSLAAKLLNVLKSMKFLMGAEVVEVVVEAVVVLAIVVVTASQKRFAVVLRVVVVVVDGVVKICGAFVWNIRNSVVGTGFGVVHTSWGKPLVLLVRGLGLLIK